MKAVQAKDLIVGRVYSDVSVLCKNSALLKHVEHQASKKAFQYVGGAKCYIEYEGVITFGAKDDFYELTPSEIEQYLPKEKL